MYKPEHLLTTKECAEYLGVSIPFLEAKHRTRGPKHIKLGPRVVRYLWKDICEYVEAGRAKA
jgi:predicted DNA-binding transcriptional regulator AlpA